MKLIFGGHWTAAPAGWTELKERDQDITKPLKWKDGTVDAIFTEHVIEHINFIQAIGFMKEAFRILKPDGLLRTVAPMTDVFTKTESLDQKFMARYAFEQMSPYYQPEISALKGIGIQEGLGVDVRPFIVDFLTRKHGHQFCWSAPLMSRVLLAIGFKAAITVKPGYSFFDMSSCLERRIRGVSQQNLESEFGTGITFDPESGVVEARK